MIVYDSTHSHDVTVIGQVNRATSISKIDRVSAALREENYLTERIQREALYQNRKRDNLAD